LRASIGDAPTRGNEMTEIWTHNDGGRSVSGYRGTTGDCVARSISIATGMEYNNVYDLINEFGEKERLSKRRRNKSSARTGVHRVTVKKIMEHLGWTWTPTMTIGSGCKVHLKADELPSGKIVCALSKHYVAVIDGMINDTHDCSRDGTRCVYGYFTKGKNR